LRGAFSATPSAARDVQRFEDATVFVEVDPAHIETLRAKFKASGITLRGEGSTLVARGPANVLASLAAQKGLRRMELTPPFKPLLDRSVLEIGAKEVHDGNTLKRQRRGKGVLIGVLDTGIDLTHPAFLDKQGRHRVIAVWDQDADGKGPRGFDYGHLCERDSIANGSCPVNDPQGHGTHVAGILVGAMAPHIGLAPEAELVVVKSTRFTDVAGAVEWMFRVAQQEGKPIVVNLSIGGHLGPHDGQSELEKSIERLQGPGKIVVAAAGNDGATPIHLGGIISEEERRTQLSLPEAGAATSTLMEIWEHGVGGPQFFVELYSADGRLKARENLIDGIEVNISADKGMRARVTYTKELPNKQNRTHHLFAIDRSGVDEKYSDDRWFFGWKSTTRFDAWISTDDYRYGSASFATEVDAAIPNVVHGDTNMTLTIPGTARGVITVGSYVTRTEWETSQGRTYRLSKVEMARLSDFSSIGPTAAPEVTGEKPDLIAPGQLIAGPRSVSASLSSTLSLDEYFAVMQGTSMSAPHVAGTVALMLELNPELEPDAAKTILVETATTDDHLEGVAPNDHSGYGRLNSLNAMARLEGTPRIAKGCDALSLGEGMTFVCMMMMAASMHLVLQRRLRLFRLRSMKSNQ
jgi:subtilisin family serine protease